MSSMIEEAAALAARSRSDDPAGLERWFNDNAEALIGQQILVADVHAHSNPLIDLPRVVHEWMAQPGHRTPAEAVAWLKEQHPGLLRAWLLSRVEDLIAEEMRQN